MPGNLASYFAQGNSNQNQQRATLSRSSSHDGFESSGINKQVPSYDDMGPSISMAVHADSDDHFKNSTFNLKRTRSMGLLDPYIDDTQKLLSESGGSLNLDSFSNTNIDDKSLNSSYSSSDSNVGNSRSIATVIQKEDKDNNEDNIGKLNTTTINDNDLHMYNSSLSPPNTGYRQDDVEINNDGNDYNVDYSDSDSREMEDSHSPPDPGTDDFLMHHDDNDLMYEPNRHVDYLSHKWNENEISQSWRYIILKKKKKDTDLINTARLENASWRTWAKARNNLKTVNPESLNWSKDSDVTWLYGPIVVDKQNTPSTASKDNESSNAKTDHSRAATIGYGSDDENSKRMVHSSRSPGPKPILKKRTVSEIIEENSKWRLDVARQHRKQIGNIHMLLDVPAHAVHDDYNAIAAKVNAQYYKGINKQATDSVDSASPAAMNNNYSSSDTDSGPTNRSTVEPLSTDIEAPQLSSILTSSMKQKEKRERHIHFNDRVEQCMAVNAIPADGIQNADDDMMSDIESHSDGMNQDRDYNRQYSDMEDGSRSSDPASTEDYADDEGDTVDNDSSEDDEEGGLFISANARKGRSNSLHSEGSDVENSLRSLSLSKYSNPIIKPLPATTLNYGSDDEYYDDEENDSYYGNAVSHNVNTSRGFDYMYDYNSVYTGDTSSFVTENACDIRDVPDGIGLDTPMDDVNDRYMDIDEDTRRNMFGHTRNQQDESQGTDSSDNEFIENSAAGKNDEDEDYSYSGSGSDSDSAIEGEGEGDMIDENDRKSSLQDMPLLRRTPSLGKSRSNSLHDFIGASNSAPPVLNQTHSFITGNSMPISTPVARRPLKGPSSGSFIFGSDSDSE